jgi:hypothetical protein
MRHLLVLLQTLHGDDHADWMIMSEALENDLEMSNGQHFVLILPDTLVAHGRARSFAAGQQSLLTCKCLRRSILDSNTQQEISKAHASALIVPRVRKTYHKIK